MMGKWPSKGGWGPSKPVQSLVSPPQAEEDVGHLLSTLAAGLRLATPRINTFSSDAIPGKTKVSFENGTIKYSVLKTIMQSQ